MKGILDRIYIIKAISGENPVQFSRLTLGEIPQIGNFLMSVWTAKYGEMGFQNFDENYLKWILGGPHKDRNFLLGGKIQNELMTYCSFLHHRILYSGNLLEGYLVTHMTLAPYLGSQVRFNCLLQTAGYIEKLYLSPNCDFMYFFSEGAKSVPELFRHLLGKYTKMDVKDIYQFSFNQFLLAAKELLKYCQENAEAINKVQVRDALEKDFGGITGLFNRASNSKAEFIVQMTEGELKHYFCGHPTHRTAVIEIQGIIEGFINYYPLEIIKGGKASEFVIIEYLILDHTNIDYMAALLKEAVNHAVEVGAKGVVIENGTYLDLDECRVLGVKPTFRKMRMTIWSKNNLVKNLDGFRCSVK